jgi:hypothetical protein
MLKDFDGHESARRFPLESPSGLVWEFSSEDRRDGEEQGKGNDWQKWDRVHEVSTCQSLWRFPMIPSKVGCMLIR